MARDPIIPMFTERDFQNSVVELARIHHWNVYSIPDSRLVSLSGFPDLTLWRGRQFFFAELKTDKGKVTEIQERVHAELRQAAQIVVVWRPKDWDEIERTLGMWPS